MLQYIWYYFQIDRNISEYDIYIMQVTFRNPMEDKLSDSLALKLPEYVYKWNSLHVYIKMPDTCTSL